MGGWTIGAALLAQAMGTMPMSAGQEKMPAPAATPMAMATATGAAAACPATPAPLAAPYAGWAAQTPLAAGTAAAAAPALAIGTGARVALADAAAVQFAVPPGHVPAAGSKGGIVALTIATPGRYRVALGAGAWIDLTRGATALPSVAHAHGPACSPVKKLVDFDLSPGRYVIQLSGTAMPAVGVMVVRVEAPAAAS